jgi:hypothetical protein
MRALFALLLLASLMACAEKVTDPRDVGVQRLKAGDQRLIGFIRSGGTTVTVPGVECDQRAVPIQVLALSADEATMLGEGLFALSFNQQLVLNDAYSGGCRVGGARTERVVRPADSVPRAESFQEIFGFAPP